ncbi:recombinase family protein [Candidatus Bipolaricaulota bacterium]|nr:recombinase family protein [Candidatus Bipolaricaulota bacterium]
MKSRLRVIGYVRVSTAKQKEGFGPQAQREAIERYCQIKGYELVAIMEEAGSGVKARPVFEKLKERVLNGEADGIIVAKLDRLGRSVRDLANIAEELRKAGKQLISVGDNIDTTSPNGKLLFHILSVIAEYERELLLERTKAGRALAEKQGKICHRPRKEVDPKVLREMKEKGLSHRMMARILGISRATLLKRLDELGLR